MFNILSINLNVAQGIGTRFKLLAATLLLSLSTAVSAVPVSHDFELLDSASGVSYTGTVVVDSSRLTPDLFTSFSDPGFISFMLTIGAESWTLADAYNPTSEGIVTDASGSILSFLDDTIQSVVLLINSNGKRLDILENNGSWSTTADASPINGPAHRFVTSASVPQPGNSCAIWPWSCGSGAKRTSRF